MASPSTTPAGKLVLEPNVPQQIALRYPTGKIVESRYGEEKQVYFSLVDGRSAYLSLGLAQSINDLNLGNREPFFICKRWNGSKQQAPRYDVWLTPSGEQSRAAQETAAAERAIPAQEPPSHLERQLAASLAEVQARRNDANLITRRPAASEQAAPPSRPVTLPAAMQGWSKALLEQTTALIDVYAEACKHAESLGVPSAVVRTVMISAFIGLQKTGGTRG